MTQESQCSGGILSLGWTKMATFTIGWLWVVKSIFMIYKEGEPWDAPLERIKFFAKVYFNCEDTQWLESQNNSNYWCTSGRLFRSKANLSIYRIYFLPKFVRILDNGQHRTLVKFCLQIPMAVLYTGFQKSHIFTSFSKAMGMGVTLTLRGKDRHPQRMPVKASVCCTSQ